MAIFSSDQALSLSGTFVDFFVRALGYRKERGGGGGADLASVDRVEREVIGAMLALTLKLALDDFKPVFYRYVLRNALQFSL